MFMIYFELSDDEWKKALEENPLLNNADSKLIMLIYSFFLNTKNVLKTLKVKLLL